MKQPIKAVILPTEDKSNIGINLSDSAIIYTTIPVKYPHQDIVQNQHLYVTVSNEVEPIKVGDWMIRGDEQPTKVTPDFYWDFGVAYRKIIATTDPKLYTNEIVEEDLHMYKKPLPQAPQSFIEEFVANPDGEFEIKYLTGHSEGRLKINKDNTVNITSVNKCDCTYVQACRICGEKKDLDGDFWKNLPPVKEKMYSKSEVIQMIWDLHNGVLNGDELKWIKENL